MSCMFCVSCFCFYYFLNLIVYSFRGVFRMFNKGQQYQQHHQQQMKTAADGKADGATDLNKLIAQLNL